MQLRTLFLLTPTRVGCGKMVAKWWQDGGKRTAVCRWKKTAVKNVRG